MSRHAIAISLLLAACSSKGGSAGAKPSQKCADYAERYAMLIDPDPARKQAALDGALAACEKGRITEEQIRCIDDASSQDGARACMGLSPLAPPKKDPPPKSTIALASVEGAGLPAELTAAQIRWRDGVQERLSWCQRIAVADGQPHSFDVVATYGSGFRGTVEGDAIPAELRDCVTNAVAASKPDSPTRMRYNEPITFHLTVQPAP